MTKKSTAYLILAFCLILAGCAAPPIVVAATEATFCDVEEPRRFSQDEIDWRAINAPWNLRKDYKTNLTWDEECK